MYFKKIKWRCQLSNLPNIHNCSQFPSFYYGYVIQNYLKIPKTSIFLINSILTTSDNQYIGSIMYYNDISVPGDNIINIVKRINCYITQSSIIIINIFWNIKITDYIIQKMEYLTQNDKILAASYFQMVLVDPYSLKAERTLFSEMIQDFQLIKDTNLAIFTLQVCTSNIVDIVNLQLILSFDACVFGTTIFTQNIFSKMFKLQDGLALFTILDTQGFQTWYFYTTPNLINFGGYLPITNSTLKYTDIDIHENYDILFAVGTSYYLSILKQSQEGIEYKVLSSMKIQNQQEQFTTLSSIQSSQKQSLLKNDSYTIQRFYIQPVFDDKQNIVSFDLTNKNNPFTLGTPGYSYTFWYYNKENQQFVLPIMSFYYKQQSLTFIYQYTSNTNNVSQYFLINSMSKIFQVDYQQKKYFVTVQSWILYVTKYNPSANYFDYDYLLYYVKQQPNTFIKVQNCPLCFITLIENSVVYFNKILEKKCSCYLNIDYFYGLNLDQINHNIDAYSDGINIWTFYAIYSDQVKQIIGVDSLGNVYAWNSQNFSQFLYKKTITQYQCLDSGIRQLYNYGNILYLIAVCQDYQIISLNIATGQTQHLYKVVSIPNQISSFEEIQLLAISDRYSSQIYLYKFNQIDGLFSTFLQFYPNQNREEVFNISYLSDTQVLWIQYEYSNLYIPIGQCLLNVNNCLKCQMNFNFNTNEKQQNDNFFGLGSTQSPYRTSKSQITPFLMIQLANNRNIIN
ncbi:hypothetical protein ABPG72_007826 [Tetrahymena utriculariae]